MHLVADQYSGFVSSSPGLGLFSGQLIVFKPISWRVGWSISLMVSNQTITDTLSEAHFFMALFADIADTIKVIIIPYFFDMPIFVTISS